MSTAEIQDNKWEVEASQPPLKNFGAVGIMIMMGGFSLFFVAVIIGAVMGSFTEVEEMDFGKKQKEAPAQAEASE